MQGQTYTGDLFPGSMEKKKKRKCISKTYKTHHGILQTTMTSRLELQSFFNCLLHERVPAHHWSPLSSYHPGLSYAPLKRGQELVALGWFSLTRGILSFLQRLPGPALSVQVPLKVWFLELCSSHPTNRLSMSITV